VRGNCNKSAGLLARCEALESSSRDADSSVGAYNDTTVETKAHRHYWALENGDEEALQIVSYTPSQSRASSGDDMISKPICGCYRPASAYTAPGRHWPPSELTAGSAELGRLHPDGVLRPGGLRHSAEGAMRTRTVEQCLRNMRAWTCSLYLRRATEYHHGLGAEAREQRASERPSIGIVTPCKRGLGRRGKGTQRILPDS
jgi:hypothetical protein